MRNIQEMKNSLVTEDPISREISLYQKRREQANQIETTLRGIKNLFLNTNIQPLKEQLAARIDFGWSDRKPHPNHHKSAAGIYDSETATNFYNRLLAEFSKKVVESPELSSGALIHSGNKEEAKVSSNTFITPETKQAPDKVQQVRFDTTIQKSYSGGSTYSSSADHQARPRPVTPRREISPPPVTVHTNYLVEPREQARFQSSVQPQEAGTVKARESDLSSQLSTVTSALVITPGVKPLATVNPAKTEIQISYPITACPSMKHFKDIKIPSSSPVTTMKCLDDRNIVLGHLDGTLRVVDISSPNGHTVRQCKLSAAIKCIESLVDSSGDNPLLEILCGLAAPDNCILKIQLQQRELHTVRYKGHTAGVNQLVAVSNTEFLSCSDDGTIRFWTTANSASVHTVKVSDQSISSLTTLSSHSTLVAGCTDGALQVYTFSKHSADRMDSAPVLRNTLLEKGPVSLVSAFYGNAKFVLSVRSTGTVRIWNVEDGECLNEISGHRGSVHSVIKITALCTTPDIYFLLLSSDESSFCFGGVDEPTVQRTPLTGKDRLHLDYTRRGEQVCQVVSGKPYDGLRLAVLENAETVENGPCVLSLWDAVVGA